MEVSLFSEWDDFRVISRGTLRAGESNATLGASSGMSLLAIVRNEMYFLPAFLDHYRQLGVRQFIVLDDKSQDGSREFLCGQPDVVVLESQRSYGDEVELDSRLLGHRRVVRMHILWRNRLIERFATNAWVIHADADEFLRIPPNLTLPSLLRRIERHWPDAEIVWTAMLDLYPQHISELERKLEGRFLDRNAEWFFDAQPHLRPRRHRRPKPLHWGSRARLLFDHDIISKPNRPAYKRALRALQGKGVDVYNMFWKPTLVRRPRGGVLLNSHTATFTRSAGVILPLEHYKFHSGLLHRANQAIERRSHYQGSRQYEHIRLLLKTMKERDGSFLTETSALVGDYQAYVVSGVAVDRARALET